VSKVLSEPSTFPFSFIHLPPHSFGYPEPYNRRNTTCCLFHLSHVSMFHFLFHLEYSPSRIFFHCINIGLILLNKQLVSDLLPLRAPLPTSHSPPQIYQTSNCGSESRGLNFGTSCNLLTWVATKFTKKYFEPRFKGPVMIDFARCSSPKKI